MMRLFEQEPELRICRMCQPRVWGAEAPSSQSCDAKSREAGFCITGRNLLFIQELR